jgi:Haemolymph juvenile hormone binding protein (JHBP)
LTDKFANDFFNQNWRVLYKEMIPETKRQWEPILLEITNKLFGQIPFRRLLLKD